MIKIYERNLRIKRTFNSNIAGHDSAAKVDFLFTKTADKSKEILTVKKARTLF